MRLKRRLLTIRRDSEKGKNGKGEQEKERGEEGGKESERGGERGEREREFVL